MPAWPSTRLNGSRQYATSSNTRRPLHNYNEDGAVSDATRHQRFVKISVWVGLGIVGLWAALDAFAKRAELEGSFPKQFRCQANEEQTLMEVQDIRKLYAHNYAGEADGKYFNNPKHKRHVLKSGKVMQLTCGAQFNGHRLSLDLRDLRYYARTVRSVLERTARPAP